MKFKKIILIISVLSSASIFAQNNIIKNGSFTDTSSWALNFYSNSQGKGSVSSGSYQIAIENAGTDRWAVQFTQSGITLDSGSIYRFSFEVMSSKVRTIEASICRNGGDYSPYSKRDTFEVTSVKKKVEMTFQMKSASDKSARVEFNCGKYDGTLTFSNVALVKVPGPLIEISYPKPGVPIYEGTPVALSWISTGIDSVKIDLSDDDGLSWKPVSGVIRDTGSYIWTPQATYSPWSTLRVSSAKDSSIHAICNQLEIAPKLELVKNGTFSDSSLNWNLGVYGGKASGIVNSKGEYEIRVDSTGTEKWHVQFSQTGIALKTGVTYTYSFTAYAKENCTIGTDITRYKSDYSSLLDSNTTQKQLTTQPQQFTIDFTVTGTSESDVRLEFDCGLAKSTIYIDNVSIVKRYQPSGTRNFKCIATPFTATISHRSISLQGQCNRSEHLNILTDLMGRCPAGVYRSRGKTVSNASGLYITSSKK